MHMTERDYYKSEEFAEAMSQAMGISEMEHEQDEVTPFGTKDEYGGL